MITAKKKDEVKAIFFSEFHPQAGPVVSYQVPENFISRDQFDVVSVYVIPKPALYGKIITVNVLGHGMVGCPSSITNKKYERNALIFNVVFVFDSKCDTQPYEAVVQKLCRYFTDAELDSSFLSNETSRARIPDILAGIRSSLNEHGGACVSLDESHTIYLTTLHHLADPLHVADHHVPIFANSADDVQGYCWDLMVQQVLPHIDGFSHIACIAARANVDLGLVRLCVQHLVYFGVVKLIPIFQYSNVYLPTPRLGAILRDSDLQEKCLKFITKHGGEKPTISAVFMTYAGLGPGVTVRDLCCRHDMAKNRIDERYLIQFGVLHGLLRRMHKYPTLLAESNDHQPWMIRLMTGSHCEDEISCATVVEDEMQNNHLGYSQPELDALLEEDPHIAVCWK